MNYPGNDPKYWLGRAEEARAIAENMCHGPAAQAMISVAETYEQLAMMAERGPLFLRAETAEELADSAPSASPYQASLSRPS